MQKILTVGTAYRYHRRMALPMTLKEAGAKLGLKPDSLRVQIGRGKMRARKLGRDFVVTPAEVARYEREFLGRHGPKAR